MPNRREHRTPLRLPVSIDRSAALSADVSDSGFHLEVMRPLKPGVVVDGFVLHGDKELKFTGVVAWAGPGHPQLSTWSRVGVRFVQVSPGLRALISMMQKKA